MPAPSSSSPPRAKPTRSAKRFTLEQARRSLPLVSRIVTDIVAAHQSAATLQARFDADEKLNGIEQHKLEANLSRLGALVTELTAVGVELKDMETGLVDFVGTHQGRPVYLCWKLGEETITHWHELDAGFGGRQPVGKLDQTV